MGPQLPTYGGPWDEQIPGLRGAKIPLGGTLPGSTRAGGQIGVGVGINIGGVWGSGQIGGGVIFSADEVKQIVSWYEVVKDHLGKIAESPDSPDVPGWIVEVRAHINNIAKKVGQVTKKRSPGAADKYLQRILGISLQDLQNLLPDLIITIDPCLLDPTLFKGCRHMGPA